MYPEMGNSLQGRQHNTNTESTVQWSCSNSCTYSQYQEIEKNICVLRRAKKINLSARPYQLVQKHLFHQGS